MKSRLLNSYQRAVEYPNVSGFEVLEFLDLRSKLAELEHVLNLSEKAALEEADETLLEHLELFYERVQEIGGLAQLRQRAKVLPSHWWWYMDKLIEIRRRRDDTGSRHCEMSIQRCNTD